MAAIIKHKPRKPATYGKTARKRLRGHEIATDVSSQVGGSSDLSDEPMPKWSGREDPVAAFPHPRAASTNKEEAQYQSKYVQFTKQARIQTNEEITHDRLSEALQASQLSAASSSAIFDVPSSSDEASMSSTTSKRPPRKSSKLDQKSGSLVPSVNVSVQCDLPQYESKVRTIKASLSHTRRAHDTNRHGKDKIVFDDESLQKHISAEEAALGQVCRSRTQKSLQPRASKTYSPSNAKNVIDDDLNRPQKDGHLKRQLQDFLHETSNSEPSDAAECLRDAGNSDGALPKKRRRMLKDQKYAWTGASARAAPQSMFPKAESGLQFHSRRGATPPLLLQKGCLPAHVRHKSKSPPVKDSDSVNPTKNLVVVGATPRQARLWDKLLDDVVSNQSSSHLKLKQLSISGCTGSKTESEQAVLMRAEKAAAPATQYPLAHSSRQRLVDAITSNDTDMHHQRKPSSSRTADSLEFAAASSFKSASPELNDISTSHGSLTASQKSSSECTPAKVQSLSNTHQGGPKVTYARQRSHLTEDYHQEDGLCPKLSNLDHIPNESKAQRGAREMLSNMNGFQTVKELNELDSDRASGAIRSIHELREAGNNKRFLDGMDAIFEEIKDRKPSNISRRRGCLIELSNKLADRDFSRRFLDLGLDKRLFVELASEHDAVLCFLLASAMMLVLSTGTSSHTASHLRAHGADQLLVRLLEEEKDISVIARQRQSNMSRVSQGLLCELRDLLQHSSVWGYHKPSKISIRVVALKCLESIVRQSHGVDASLHPLSHEAVSQLIQVLASCIRSVAERGHSGTQIIEASSALSVLELHTTKNAIEKTHWTMDMFSVVFEVISTICSWREGSFRQIQTLALRITINLTNNNATLCDNFATTTLMEAKVSTVIRGFGLLSLGGEEEERLLALDHLILALGSLINFAEWSDIARHRLTEVRGREGSLLDMLVGLFQNRVEKALLADSMEETHSNVAFGYLSVLLGNISQNPVAKWHICNKLPGGTLHTLIDAIEEFIQYHKRVDAELYDSDDGTDLQAGFTDRLQSVLNRLKT